MNALWTMTMLRYTKVCYLFVIAIAIIVIDTPATLANVFHVVLNWCLVCVCVLYHPACFSWWLTHFLLIFMANKKKSSTKTNKQLRIEQRKMENDKHIITITAHSFASFCFVRFVYSFSQLLTSSHHHVNGNW